MNYKKIIRICAFVMGFSGMVILFSSLYPILSYEWYSEVQYPELVSPFVDKNSGGYKFGLSKDLTKASNWFDGGSGNNYSTSLVSYYTLSVPKLRIDNARVAIGGDDLKNNLVQYDGTANPGKTGNTVVFGHSILPQYFDPENYMSIFSTLPRLKVNDEIYVNYDGVSYTYKVTDIFEVKPRDLWVLDQDESGSFISLITCSPPGHPLKPRRLVVKAQLQTV